MKYQEIFEQLWADYREINPSVDKIHKLLKAKGEQIVNDHIAFRTYNIKGINIEALAVPFLEAGYVEKGRYNFDAKKLDAKHYEHENDSMAPKVFISELRIEELSPLVQETVRWVASGVKKNNLRGLDLLFAKRCWEPINYTSYEALRKESEYAAWLYVYGFRANHFTVFINYLKSITSIEGMNGFLSENGFDMNNAGGEIKGTKEECLKQSSILADKITVDFQDGQHSVPCCYYEFAERFKNKEGELFNGFIAKSADKIFESTDKE